MATPTIKSTYALDVETVRTLDRVAQSWNVSKSEALRRAIRAVASGGLPRAEGATQVLDELQRSLNLTDAKARAWARRARAERRASSRRSEPSGR